jgi:dTDP-4-dehydrorhamnose reductase
VHFPQAHGLYHVSSEPISKYALLVLIRDTLGIKLQILEDKEFRCDRSLKSDRFRDEFRYTPPSWKAMVDELAQEIKGTANDF